MEVKTSSSGYGAGAYHYAVTQTGIERARTEVQRNSYTGPAPVSLTAYINAMRNQKGRNRTVTKNEIVGMLSNLILSPDTIDKIGPAVNSGSSIFLYGPPGNGKTSIARAIGELVNKGQMYIPYAIFVDGQIIKVFDETMHHRIDNESGGRSDLALAIGKDEPDQRWVLIRRPFIIVGGELTLAGMDLVFNEDTKFYEAPFQVKANGGVLLVDDFGRQLVRPVDLLNRWIIPLENKVDFLSLHTGKKLEVPFDVMVVFSTNLPPKDLVDESFLRRLRHKVEIKDPSLEQFHEIFVRIASSKQVEFVEAGYDYLIKEWYQRTARKLRSSHPKEICDQIIDIARYHNIKPATTIELVSQAASAFFVDL